MLNERTSGSNSQFSGKSSIEPWIIDIGAVNHMIGTMDFWVDVFKMTHMVIKLMMDVSQSPQKLERQYWVYVLS